MADIEPPAFSLGLEFDLDFDLPCQAADSPTPETSAPPKENNESLPVTDSRPDSPPPIFRRLRRGLPTKTKEPPLLSRESEHPFPDSVEDDIEEFSPEELEARTDNQSAPKAQSVCSGTKISLRRHGIVTKQAPKEPCTKMKQAFDAPSTSSAATKGMPIFSDGTMSPLRRFQLIDSDSDDMSDFKDAGVHIGGIKVTNKGEFNISSSTAADGKRSDPLPQSQPKVDLWKDFLPKENFNISTPALDEFCQEYFRTPKDTKSGPDAIRGSGETQGGTNKRARVGAEKEQQIDLEHSLPPAHSYFFHDDPRIQRLVQSRLCHFQPLCPVNNAGNQQHNASTIDYRSQFNNESSSKQKITGTRANTATVSRRAGSSSKRTRGKGTINSTEEWVNPKSSVSAPKDATRRRVHASDGSVGQWRTDENGKKVYISKSGQEFSGQSAYRCYKKENGGFRKSKKKPAARKKK